MLMKYSQFLKKAIILLCLTLTAGYVQAQQRYYCEVKGTENDLRTGLMIILDFGTQIPYDIWGDLSTKLKLVDEKGKDINFNSMVDAANYMSARGWKFQQAYSSVYGEKNITHWIFYKDADNMDQAREGIIIRSEYKRLNNNSN